MKFSLDKDAFKTFSKTLQICNKLGEDLFFDINDDLFIVQAVNDQKSLMFINNFEKNFFLNFQSTGNFSCKFKSKYILVPFKLSIIQEKNLNLCEIELNSSKDSAIFKLNFEIDNDLESIHEINFSESNLSSDLFLESQGDNFIMAKVKNLLNIFNNFPNLNGYVILKVYTDKVEFDTYNLKKDEIKTNFCLSSEIFQEYKINKKFCVSFTLKPLKTFLSSSEKNSNCYLYLNEDSPMQIIMKSSNIETKLVLGCLSIEDGLSTMNNSPCSSKNTITTITDFNYNTSRQSMSQDTNSEKRDFEIEEDIPDFNKNSSEIPNTRNNNQEFQQNKRKKIDMYLSQDPSQQDISQYTSSADSDKNLSLIQTINKQIINTYENEQQVNKSQNSLSQKSERISKHTFTNNQSTQNKNQSIKIDSPMLSRILPNESNYTKNYDLKTNSIEKSFEFDKNNFETFQVNKNSCTKDLSFSETDNSQNNLNSQTNKESSGEIVNEVIETLTKYIDEDEFSIEVENMSSPLKETTSNIKNYENFLEKLPVIAGENFGVDEEKKLFDSFIVNFRHLLP